MNRAEKIELIELLEETTLPDPATRRRRMLEAEQRLKAINHRWALACPKAPSMAAWMELLKMGEIFDSTGVWPEAPPLTMDECIVIGFGLRPGEQERLEKQRDTRKAKEKRIEKESQLDARLESDLAVEPPAEPQRKTAPPGRVPKKEWWDASPADPAPTSRLATGVGSQSKAVPPDQTAKEAERDSGEIMRRFLSTGR